MDVITTARKPDIALVEEATRIARVGGLEYVERGNESLDKLKSKYNLVMLLSKQGLSCHTMGGELFFHPNMAAVRIKQMQLGEQDKMLVAMDIKEGDRVLDCTAGLCSDSLVAAWGVGDTGRVIALEASKATYTVVNYGLKNYTGPERFRHLLPRISLVNTDFREYLSGIEPGSFDIVYFDPMFDVPVMEASSMLPLRPLANHEPLRPQDIALAAKVARKRVVVKQRNFFDFASLGLEDVVGSQNRKVAYGVLKIKEN